ncbi:MAG: S8 family serine peptidase [Fervidobacterium sp.]
MKRVLITLGIIIAILAIFSCSSPKTVFEPRSQDKSDGQPKFDITKIVKPNGYGIVFGELKDGEYVEGKILVGYEDYGSVEKIAKALNGKIVFEIPQIKVVSIKFNGKIQDAYKKIRSLGITGIRYVEPSYKRDLIKPTVVEKNPEMLKKERISLTNNRNYGEELSNELWGLEALGITQSLWDEASGTDVIVAVVDTGVDGTHPDLQGQVTKGYRPYTKEILQEGADSSYGGAHGTHVAGTIAAKKDGKGIVGVAPNAKIMPIVIFDDPALVGGNGYVGDDYVAAGIVWAVDNGAKVMNHSWGGWGYSHTMKAAFDYALAHNVAMVCSAGNNHSDSHHQYPANYPGVIQVAAVEYNGGSYRTTNFSSRSDMVTVGAPGVTILSTVPGTSSRGYGGHNSNVRVTNKGTYDYYQGTSMAAPHVTGAIAVLLQKYPNAKVWQIRKLLENTAQDIDKPGWDNDSGAGLIKLNQAINSELPVSGGIERLVVKVTDASDSFGIPTVFVQFKDLNGRLYAAKTNPGGFAEFYQIDQVNLNAAELFVGGPDHMDRAEASVEGQSVPGGWTISLRMQEERQANNSSLYAISSSTTETVFGIKFSSEFKVKFKTNISGATVILTDPEASNVYFVTPYERNRDYDFSNMSGQIVVGILTTKPQSNDVTVEGTVTLNGYSIPIRSTIKKGSSWAVVDDFNGQNFGTPEQPLYAWWTVFGKQ